MAELSCLRQGLLCAGLGGSHSEHPERLSGALGELSLNLLSELNKFIFNLFVDVLWNKDLIHLSQHGKVACLLMR